MSLLDTQRPESLDLLTRANDPHSVAVKNESRSATGKSGPDEATKQAVKAKSY
jgi:hypothetical protein